MPAFALLTVLTLQGQMKKQANALEALCSVELYNDSLK